MTNGSDIAETTDGGLRAQWRRRLGPVGVGLVSNSSMADWRQAAVRAEQLGYGSLWTNEAIGGRDVFAHLGVLLGATERLVVGSGVANLWTRQAGTMRGASATLADAYPGRFVLGLGVSHPMLVSGSGQQWVSPMQRTRDYLDQMDAATGTLATPAIPAPRLLGALGPKMLELAAERADGAHPYALPVEHTRQARAALGPDKLLVVGVGFVRSDDLATGLAAVRDSGIGKIPDSPYDRALHRLGYPADEVANGGSDRVLADRFAIGDADAIAERVAAHLAAGADHVYLGSLATMTFDLGTVLDEYAAIAPALLAAV